MINLLVVDTDMYYGKCIEKTLKKLNQPELFYMGQVDSLTALIKIQRRESIDLLIISDYFYEKLPQAVELTNFPSAYVLVTTLDIHYDQKLQKINEHCEILYKPFDIKPFTKQIQAMVKAKGEKASPVSDNSTQKLAYILSYIKDHLQEELTLAILAQKIYYSPSYLSKVFKDYTGSSLSDYIRNLRISRAEMLLQTTDYQIQEIAEMVGIPKMNTFGTVFRHMTGVSPREFRNLKFKEKKGL